MGSTNPNTKVGKEKKLAILLGIVGLLATGFMISTIILGVKLKDKSDSDPGSDLNSDVCNTEECVKAAGDILKAIDKTVNPCEDFYEFSCGNWIKNNPIPETTSLWNQFNVLREQLNRKIRGIVETDIKELEPASVKHGKLFYKSCMAQNVTDQIVLEQLIETDLKVGDLSNIANKLGQLRSRTGGQFLVTLYVELDEKKTSNYIIYLDQPSLGLNRAFLLANDHDNKKAYTELISMCWNLVYPNEVGPANIAKDIVDFETKIAKISTAPEDRRNRTELYNLLKLEQLGEHTSNATMFVWEDYITEVFKAVVQSHNVDLGDLSKLSVVVRDMKYYKEFGHLLSTSSEADRTILANYLRWRVILTYGNDVSSKLRDVFFEFNKKTQGTLYPAPRWQVCSDRANAAFGMAISYHYVQEVFSGNFTSQMKEMIGNIQESFFEIIDEVEWIGTDDTRSKAKTKASKMLAFIGYPEWLLSNSTALGEHYKGLELNPSINYFESFLVISKWKNEESLRNIKESKNSKKWITDPTVVNAFYSSTYNSISFPAGILQPPFYFTGKPIQALNYGAVGMVIGHEISHGFDDRGRQSDGDGNLVDWWDKETVNQYVERANCFINQYSSYEAAENLTINGNNTLGENIADNGGLRQSFRAYQSYVKKHGEEKKLPGLEYSPKQLFFIAFSQIWCGSYTKQGMESQVRTGVHSPNRFRVKGVLENSVEFAETWNCPAPDLQKTCRLW